jgi:hypothetical protein
MYDSAFHDELDKELNRLLRLLQAQKPPEKPVDLATKIMYRCTKRGWPLYPTWEHCWLVQGFLASGRFSAPPLADETTADALFNVFESMAWLIAGPPSAAIHKQRQPTAYQIQKHQSQLCERCADYLALRGQKVKFDGRSGREQDVSTDALAVSLLCEDRNITNAEIARRLGVTRGRVSQLKRLKEVRQTMRLDGARGKLRCSQRFGGDETELYADERL